MSFQQEKALIGHTTVTATCNKGPVHGKKGQPPFDIRHFERPVAFSSMHAVRRYAGEQLTLAHLSHRITGCKQEPLITVQVGDLYQLRYVTKFPLQIRKT